MPVDYSPNGTDEPSDRDGRRERDQDEHDGHT
jgi:hypothetical protein